MQCRSVIGPVKTYCRLVLIATFIGCSGGSTATYPVTGTVKFADGKPLAGGHLLFQPVGMAAGVARGVIAADGSFEVGTFHSNDGAVAGKHKVMITPAVPDDAVEDPAKSERYRSVIHARYQNVRTTPLEFTVKDDGSANNFDIVVESSKAAGAAKNRRKL